MGGDSRLTGVSSGHHTGNGNGLSLDTTFFHGIPTSSNAQNLYIQVATNASGSNNGGVDASGNAIPSTASNSSIVAQGSNSPNGDFWVTCPWPSTIKKMLEHPNLIYTLLNQLKAHPTMKSKAIKILTGEISAGNNRNTSDGGMGAGDFNFPPSPTMSANAQNLNLFSPNGNDSPGLWSSGNEFGTSGQSFRAGGPVSLSCFSSLTLAPFPPKLSVHVAQL